MVDELAGPEGITSEVEGREVLEMLGELPDLWDVQLGDLRRRRALLALRQGGRARSPTSPS